MTLDEAKADLSIQREVKRRLGIDHEAEALGLGYEALKQLKREREKGVGFWADRLPGETEE
jgi:hypothetical protein